MEAVAAESERNREETQCGEMNMRKRSSFKLQSNPSLDTLRLRRVFDLFDKNEDSLLTMDEISKALLLLGLDADPMELQSIIASFIKTGHHGLAFEDFQALHRSLNDTFFGSGDYQQEQEEAYAEADADADAVPSAHAHIAQDQTDADKQKQLLMPQQQQQLESDLTEAFKVFDEDGDGYISAKELQVVLSKLGLPQADQELSHIQLMISSFDHNSDGLVDFLEFKHMMLHSLLLTSS